MCLTLLLTIIHRFGLHADDLPLAKEDSWIRWFLTANGSGTDIDKLSPTQNDLLGDWIRALFETEGIKDELLARCSPQDFYKMVPALVGQILAIHQQGSLPGNKLQNGYDCEMYAPRIVSLVDLQTVLQQTIILPCLLLGLPIVINHALKHDAQLPTVLDALRRLSCATSSADEHTILQHALKTTGSQLLESFGQHEHGLHPKDEKISSFFQHQARKSSCRALTRISHETVSRNRDATPPSMLRQLGYNFDELCSWSSLELASTLPPYSHGNLILLVQCCGAADVLKSLIDCILQHATSSLNGNDDIPLDLATSIICAYETSAGGRGNAPLSLLQALRLERKNAAKLIAKDAQRAEVLVHLHRLVESQLASPEQVAGMQRGLPPMMNQDQLRRSLGNIAQDEPMLDFVDQGVGFDTNMDLGFDAQGIFDSGPQDLNAAQAPMDFSREQLQQDQQGDVDFQSQQQQQQQVNDLFSNVDTGNAFFDQQMQGSFFGPNEEQEQAQQQAQQPQQEQQPPDALGLDGAQDQIAPMDDDDFWASLGVNNDY